MQKENQLAGYTTGQQNKITKVTKYYQKSHHRWNSTLTNATHTLYEWSQPHLHLENVDYVYLDKRRLAEYIADQ